MLTGVIASLLVVAVVAYIWGVLLVKSQGEARRYWWVYPEDEGDAFILGVILACSWVSILIIYLYERRKPAKAVEE